MGRGEGWNDKEIDVIDIDIPSPGRTDRKPSSERHKYL